MVKLSTLPLLLVAAASPALAGQQIASATVPNRIPSQVLKSLARHCIKGGSTVESITDMTLVCAQPISGMKGFMAQALLGNSYSTSPVRRIRFTAIDEGAHTILQFSGAIEMVSAYGKPMVTPLDVKPADVAKVVQAASDPVAAPPAPIDPPAIAPTEALPEPH